MSNDTRDPIRELAKQAALALHMHYGWGTSRPLTVVEVDLVENILRSAGVTFGGEAVVRDFMRKIYGVMDDDEILTADQVEGVVRDHFRDASATGSGEDVTEHDLNCAVSTPIEKRMIDEMIAARDAPPAEPKTVEVRFAVHFKKDGTPYVCQLDGSNDDFLPYVVMKASIPRPADIAAEVE